MRKLSAAARTTRSTVLRPYRTPYRTVEHSWTARYGTGTGHPYPSNARKLYGRTRIRVRWASLQVLLYYLYNELVAR